jgi:hypothetical protein
MRVLFIVSVVIACAFHQQSASAQALSPEEAKAKLAAKEQQRLADRGQLIQTTSGELADLQLRIRQLEAEVSSLRSQLGQKEVAKKTTFHVIIEIGMTKDEVLAFVKRTKSLRVVGMSADTGTSKSAEEVTVRGNSSGTKDVTVTKNDDDPTRTKTQTNQSGTSKVEVERVHSSGLKETIRIDRTASSREVVGSHSRGLGFGNEDDMADVTRVVGHIVVNLTDGVVTSVDAR